MPAAPGEREITDGQGSTLQPVGGPTLQQMDVPEGIPVWGESMLEQAYPEGLWEGPQWSNGRVVGKEQ